MSLRALFVSSVSACLEAVNASPFYAPKPYDVYVNGSLTLEGVRENVFSLFDLKPGTAYRVCVGAEELLLTTRTETAAINARDFLAAGDGDAADALQSAINACPKGGRVVVPEGVYRIAPLSLRSHITIELKKGATLLADTDPDAYPILPGEITDEQTGGKLQISTWEGEPRPSHKSILSAYGETDIIITGRGTIDGNAQNAPWWIEPKKRRAGRPRLMFLNRCERVTVHGITAMNSPAWHFHPFFCKEVSFLDMAVTAPDNSPNTDGINPESCEEVRIIGVRFSVGDDAIAIKSGKMYMGINYQTPASRHTIRNCLMERAHGAVVLGSEMSGGVRELSVSQCLFRKTDRGLRIKTRRGRGKYGVIDNITFSNIRMERVLTPLVINMFYFCDPDGHEETVWSKEKQPVDDTTPYLGAFTFSDMTCVDCEWAAAFFYGLPEQPIGSVTIERVRFTFAKDASSGKPAMMDFIPDYCRAGLYMNGVKRVTLNEVYMEGQNGERLICHGADEVVAQWTK